ncbi:MAG TPA: YbjN domain-containing protein [Thermoleophilaceae bacterium]|nr:YbjN domain-containing protein [Thermoleophilaceae bacterium]
MAAVDVIDDYVAGLPGDARRLAHAEWGIRLRAESAGGHPLDMSVRVDDELVKAQAFALPAQEGIDPWLLLHWNRQTRLVRFACTRSGDIWVHGELPVAAVDERAVDRLLGLIVEGAVAVRGYAATATAPPA